MKKIVLLIFVSIFAFAANNTTYSNVIELTKSKRVSLFIQKEQLIFDAINDYLLLSGDFQSIENWSTIANQINIKNKIINDYANGDNVFKNFDDDNNITIEFAVSNQPPYNLKMYLKNTITLSGKKDLLRNTYLTSLERNPEAKTSTYTYKLNGKDIESSVVLFPMKAKTLNLYKTYLTLKENFSSNDYIFSQTPPDLSITSNKTKTWIKPNNYGGYFIYISKDGNNWFLMGDPMAEGMMVLDKTLLTKIKVLPGSIAWVQK